VRRIALAPKARPRTASECEEKRRGRCFATWETFEAHLDVWTREVADIRIHGTTGEVLIARFTRAEAKEADQRHPAVPRHARADPACRL
jgi:hypothetical protein